MEKKPRTADLFVKEIDRQVRLTLREKHVSDEKRPSPSDTAKALEELGYIQLDDNAFIITELGENVLLDESIRNLTGEVIDQINSHSTLGVERFKCYECEKLKPEGHFGSNCEFKKADGERHRLSQSPCKSCLARYHIKRSKISG